MNETTQPHGNYDVFGELVTNLYEFIHFNWHPFVRSKNRKFLYKSYHTNSYEIATLQKLS